MNIILMMIYQIYKDIIDKAKININDNKKYNKYLEKYSNIKNMFCSDYVKNEYIKLLNNK